MATTRAKFMCSSVEMHSAQPYETTTYPDGTTANAVKRMTWPRNYKFTAVYDPTVPEDQRYALATPSGQVTIRIDNPAVSFEPGKYYYLDFTEADAA